MLIFSTNEYIAWRLKERGNTSREGINKTLTPSHKAIKYAADNELLSHKVASTISNNYLKSKIGSIKFEVEDKDVHYLTPEQMQQFVDWYPKVQNMTEPERLWICFYFHFMLADCVFQTLSRLNGHI